MIARAAAISMATRKQFEEKGKKRKKTVSDCIFY